MAQNIDRVLIQTNESAIRDDGSAKMTASTANVYVSTGSPPEAQQMAPTQPISQISALKEIKAWKVIGWSEENVKGILIFRYSDIRLPEEYNCTDTIFPVLGKPVRGRGVEEIEVMARFDDKNSPTNRITQEHYPYNLNLRLELDKKSVQIPSQRRRVAFPDGKTVVITSLANTRLNVVGQHRQYLEMTASGKVHKIYSIHHTNAPTNAIPYIGIYRPTVGPVVVLQSPHTLVMDYKNNPKLPMQRFCYLVSKESLLVFTERLDAKPTREKPKGFKTFNTLLKEYTYVVIEGFGSYFYDDLVSETGISRPIIPKSLDFIPYVPKIVVIGEGVNQVIEFESNYEFKSDQQLTQIHYRVSVLVLYDQKSKPNIIDWYQFCKDFENVQTVQNLSVFRVEMNYKDIADHLILAAKRNAFRRHFIFSLCKYSSYRDSTMTDFWNIYVQNENNAHYYYYVISVILYWNDKSGEQTDPCPYLTLNGYTARASSLLAHEPVPDYVVDIRQMFEGKAQECFDAITFCCLSPRSYFENRALYTEERFRLLEKKNIGFYDGTNPAHKQYSAKKKPHN